MGTASLQVTGHVAPGFEPVRGAFARNLARDDEVGAACCVYFGGKAVVDVWGGLADRETGRAWDRDTTGIVLSSTKGVTAICVCLLLERGEIELATPIATVWPEFAAAGKQAITVEQVLTHRAGLAVVEGTLTLEEVCAWDPVVAAIAAQVPGWEPGTAHGYHVRSFGWILGEVVRRITGRSLGTFFAEEIARPLGLDFFIGLPEREEPHVATLYGPPEPTDPEALALRERFMGPDTVLGKALSGPSGLFRYGDMWNERALRAAEMPSSNGIGSARALARLYAATVGEVDGVRVLKPETVALAAAPRVEGKDGIIMVPTRFGLGFMLPPALGQRCPAGAFGHPGAGGSLGFADPTTGVGFGYVMNQMQLGVTGDPRSEALVEALRGCLPGG